MLTTQNISRSIAVTTLAISCTHTFAADTIKVYDGDQKNIVFVIRPPGEHFASVVKGIVDDVEGDIKVIDYQSDKLVVENLIFQLKKEKPNAVVLMGNGTINVYRDNIKKMPENLAVVSVAALFVDRVTTGIPNSTGILYEIPAVTGLSSLRNIVTSPIKRVGVLYREQFGDAITKNAQFAKRENIELVGFPISSSPDYQEVASALSKLSSAKVDAVWVTNDSGLLQPQMVGGSWIPFFKNFAKPAVVGVETLAKTEFNFGSFVIFPDHYGLGAQTAGLLLELMDNDWDASSVAIAQPISVKKHLNMAVTEKRGIKINNTNLNTIDKVIK